MVLPTLILNTLWGGGVFLYPIYDDPWLRTIRELNYIGFQMLIPLESSPPMEDKTDYPVKIQRTKRHEPGEDYHGENASWADPQF